MAKNRGTSTIQPEDLFAGSRTFRTTQNDWGALTNSFRNFKSGMKGMIQDWMDETGFAIVKEVRLFISQNNLHFTGTYFNSFEYKVTEGAGGMPMLHVGHLNPRGTNIDRLPIYWKVLETGAKPNPNLSASPGGKQQGRGKMQKDPRTVLFLVSQGAPGSLLAWSIAKFNTPIVGQRIAFHNRMGNRGIRAHPILSRIFILSGPNLTVVGLTPFGNSLVKTALNESMNTFKVQVFSKESRFRRRGRDVSVKRDIRTGQFARG